MFTYSEKTYTYKQKREGALNYGEIRNTLVSKDLPIDCISYLINEGHAYTHNYDGNGTSSKNFVSTHFVAIDIDNSDKTMDDVLSSLFLVKPTIAYNTASHGVKGNRFRFVYIFQNEIDKYHYVPLVQSVMHHIGNECGIECDACSTKMAQPYIGFDSSDDGKAYKFYPNKVYTLTKFPHTPLTEEEYDRLVTATHKQKQGMDIEKKIEVPDTQFFKDYYEMNEYDFTIKYNDFIVPLETNNITLESEIAEYFDKDSYMCVSIPFNEKGIIRDGQHRRSKLYSDGMILRKIHKDITLEQMVATMMHIVYYLKKYDNLDGEIDVLHKAVEVMNKTVEEVEYYEYRGIRKGFRMKKDAADKYGVSIKALVPIAAKQKRMYDRMKVYNPHLTIKENVKQMNEQGLKTYEASLKRYLSEYNIPRKLKDEDKLRLYDASKTVKQNYEIIKSELDETGVKWSFRSMYDFCKKYGINPKGNHGEG